MSEDIALKLYQAAQRAFDQMCRATAPDHTFTDAVDELDMALIAARTDLGIKQDWQA